MKRRRYKTDEIIEILREVDASGNLAEVCRKHGIAKTTIYAWKARYGGMNVQDAKRLKELEQENAKLKRLLGESELDKAALKELLGRKW